MDIGIDWDRDRGVGDWVFGIGDLGTASSIESAVYVSLFTDRIASPDFKPTDGTADRRGWWGDTYQRSPVGSRLWQLDRAKKSDATKLRLQATDYCKEALQWLIDDGVVERVEVKVQWIAADALGIEITITEPRGTQRRPFYFRWAWSS